MSSFTLAITRRRLLILVGSTAGVKMVHAFASEGVNIAPQPYLAEVKRALEALTQLGAPLETSEAQRIATLARRNDSVHSVNRVVLGERG